MAKAKKTEQEEPLEKKLWKAADKLRKNMDAAEYKHVALGLIFLKYISDAFEEQYQKLVEQKSDGADPEDKNEYLADNVFFVPVTARWNYLQGRATQTTIGKDIDDAMDAIEKDNYSLKGVLPKVFAQEKLDKTSLGGLVNLIGTITLGSKEAKSKDLLGQVFEFFLGEFALAEGKKGGQFYTPASVVKLLVEILEPYEGRVYDPCCGSGGMFVQSEKFIKTHQDYYIKNEKTKVSKQLEQIDRISIYGQESNQTTWRLAKMNLSIRGIDSSNVKWNTEGSFLKNEHKDLKADYIIANPPFNDSDWSGELLRTDARWSYGVPSVNNANFAWMQHFVYHLSPKGKAAIVMHGGAASNKGQTESLIRKNLVLKGLVDCIIALPTQLFSNTTLPVHIWILNRSPKPEKSDILMIDAYNLGSMKESTIRELTDVDISKIAETYHNWKNKDLNYSDIVGFSKSVCFEDVENKSFIISPNRYIERLKKDRIIPFKEDVSNFLDKSITYSDKILNYINENDFTKDIYKNNFINDFDKIFDKSEWDNIEVLEVIDCTVSGSWGNEEPKKDNVAVKVIRGTDLPNIPLFNLKKTPTRYLNADKVEEIQLQENDIVIELSGGSKDQPTGRCAIVTKELMEYFDMPLICSNFCKVIRLDVEKVNPFWFFFYWSQCYHEGLTTRYENQPSGIKNFQLDEFLTSELISLPPRPIQDNLSKQLKNLFELKNKLSYTNYNLTKIIEKSFENLYYNFNDEN